MVANVNIGTNYYNPFAQDAEIVVADESGAPPSPPPPPTTTPTNPAVIISLSANAEASLAQIAQNTTTQGGNPNVVYNPDGTLQNRVPETVVVTGTTSPQGPVSNRITNYTIDGWNEADGFTFSSNDVNNGSEFLLVANNSSPPRAYLKQRGSKVYLVQNKAAVKDSINKIQDALGKLGYLNLGLGALTLKQVASQLVIGAAAKATLAAAFSGGWALAGSLAVQTYGDYIERYEDFVDLQLDTWESEVEVADWNDLEHLGE